MNIRISTAKSLGKLLICSTVFAALACTSCAAAPDRVELLAKMMDEVKTNHAPAVKNKDIVDGDPEPVLAALTAYEKHADRRIRDRAYTLVWNIGTANSSLEVRRDVVNRLAKACADDDSLVWRRAADHLMSFAEQDFADSAKGQIKKLVAGRSNPCMIVVCGAANLRELIPSLRTIADTALEARPHAHGPNLAENQAWAARLALARMGSKEDIAFCCNRVRSDHSVLLRSSSILEQLAYIRQSEVIPVLREYLDSNEYLPSTRGEGNGVSYAQLAADALAGIVDGFPIDYSGSCASQADVEKARAWMREHSEYTLNRSVSRPGGLRW